MPKRRGFFEFLKDILVSTMTAFGTAIETFYQMMTRGSYNKEDEKMQKLINLLNEYKEKSSAKPDIGNFSYPESYPDEKSNIDIQNSFQDFKIALTQNAKNVISANIDTILENDKFSCNFISGEKVFRLTSDVTKNNTASINIFDNETNKKVFSCLFVIEKNNDGQNKEVYKDEAFHIKTLDELNIVDKSKTPMLTEQQFFKEIQSVAEKTNQEGKMFFAFNGHLFNVRKDQTNQFIIFDSKSKLIGKWAEGVSLLDNGYKITDKEENKKTFERLLYAGKTVLKEAEPKTKEDFETTLKQQGVLLKSINDKEVVIAFNDKKNKKIVNIAIDTKTCKTTNADTHEKQWMPLTLKAYILNNINKLSNYNNSEFNVNNLLSYLKDEKYDLAEQEIKKIKTITEMENVFSTISTSNLPNKKDGQALLENYRVQIQENIISYIKDEKPENIEEVAKMLSGYDNADVLSDLNYVVKHDDSISKSQKATFEKACKLRIEEMPSKSSKCKIPKNCRLEELQRYKEHLDPNVAKDAEEKMIKNVSDFIISCSYSNKQEELESELPQMLTYIDDTSTLNAIKEKVENECFMGDNMQYKFLQIFNERENKINKGDNEVNKGDNREDIEY